MVRCGKLLLAGVLLAGVSGCSRATGTAGTPSAAGLQAEMVRIFDRSARDWNAGDLDGFMSDYARDTTTSYISGGNVRYGYDRIREAYAGRFAPGASRDSLRFENLAARLRRWLEREATRLMADDLAFFADRAGIPTPSLRLTSASPPSSRT